jgi:hypothetical protein
VGVHYAISQLLRGVVSEYCDSILASFFLLEKCKVIFRLFLIVHNFVINLLMYGILSLFMGCIAHWSGFNRASELTASNRVIKPLYANFAIMRALWLDFGGVYVNLSSV